MTEQQVLGYCLVSLPILVIYLAVTINFASTPGKTWIGVIMFSAPLVIVGLAFIFS